MAAAEIVGLAIPGAAWAAAWSLRLHPLALYAVIVAAGAGEGFVLGSAQGSLLKRRVADIRAPWTAATAAGAAAAWAMGMAPTTLVDLGLPAWAAIVAGVVLAMPLLLSIGFAQWMVLRPRTGPRSWRWVAWNVVAWLAGLPATFISPALVPDGAPALAFALAFAAGGLVMAVTVAAVTGWAARRIPFLGPTG